MLNHPRSWSELSSDLLESIFEKLSFTDFHRAKLVCSTWNSSSKRTVSRKSEPPWLILFPDSEENVCLLFNPEEDRIYTTERDFSKIRFLANSGKWFLVVDSCFNLCIIDVFNENRRIDLPPLESLLSSKYSLKRVRDKEFRWGLTSGSCLEMKTDNLRGLLWVDEKTEEFVVVWFFDPVGYLFFCKKGDTHYTFIPLYDEVPKLLSGFSDLVLRCYRLYIATTHRCVRVLDLSGHQGFEDVTGSNPKPMFSLRKYYASFSIAVTKDGEVLLVESTNFENRRSFRIYKKDPNADLNEYSPDLLEVDSVGDEALLLDLGIIMPANHTIGIKPNTIYFTRHDRARLRIPFDLDICVFNLATNTLKRFPQLAGLNLKDARWFLPFT